MPAIRLSALLFTLWTLSTVPVSAQQVYTAKKGPRIFPGHWHVVVTLDKDSLRYELFNHWYTQSYMQYRDLTIAIDDLEAFNTTSDSLQIRLHGKKIRVRDKRHRLRTRVKRDRLCASADHMRKISYACAIARNADYHHRALYDAEDLLLSEEAFRQQVEENAARLARE